MATNAHLTANIHLHDGDTITTKVAVDDPRPYAVIDLGANVTIFVHDASAMQALRSAILEVALEMTNATRVSH